MVRGTLWLVWTLGQGAEKSRLICSAAGRGTDKKPVQHSANGKGSTEAALLTTVLVRRRSSTGRKSRDQSKQDGRGCCTSPSVVTVADSTTAIAGGGRARLRSRQEGRAQLRGPRWLRVWAYRHLPAVDVRAPSECVGWWRRVSKLLLSTLPRRIQSVDIKD